jgi:hypothetical protein
VFSPLISLSSRGSPGLTRPSITAIPDSVLLGSKPALLGGKQSIFFVSTTICLEFPLSEEASHGAHLNEGNAIKIKINAGVIVQINSINVVI